MDRLKLFMFCLLLAVNAALPSASLAEDYYVDPINGDDSNPGTTAAPWRTLAKAKTVANYGDTVLLRGDENSPYGDFTDTRTTTGTGWIRYKADSGHTPVLDYVQIGSSSQISSDAHIELDGLTITNGLRIYARNHIDVRNCDIQFGSFTGNAVYGVWTATETPDHITIENCEIHHAYRGINAGGDYWTIKNNNIHYIAEDGIHGGESNVLIEGNKIWDIDYRYGESGIHSDGIQWVQSTPRENIIVRGNEFYGGWTNGGGALFISAGGGAWTNIRVENNLFYDLTGNILLIGGVDLYVHNNTIIRKPGVGGHVKVYDVAEMHNNIFSDLWSNGNIISHGNNIFGGIIGFTTEPTELIVGTLGELFVDMSNHDYRLAEGSAAVDFGNPDYGPDTDILGQQRDAQPDAGCYEYVSGPADSTPPSTPQNLTAQVISESQIDLSWQQSTDPESGLRYYRIYQNDNPVATPSSTTYSDTGLSAGTEYSYQVSAINWQGLESDKSNIASATTSQDTTAPTILSAGATSETTVTVVFSEALEAASAEDTSNYDITGGVSVTSASLAEDLIRVILTTSSHAEGSYTLTVQAVRDVAGNPMVTDSVDYDYTIGLVAHWKFDEAGGSTAFDSSGSGYDGTLINGPVWTTGRLGGALRFDGTNNYVDVGAQDIAAPWTASFWVKREDSSNSNTALLDSANYSLKLEQYPNLNKVGFTAYGVADHAFNYEAPIGSWAHLVFVGTQTQVTLYVDGASTETIAASISCPMAQISSASKATKGTIDEVRIYNRALSAAEILELYDTGSGSGTNNPPVLAVVGDKSVDENSLLSFSISAADPDGDSITYSAENLPTGADWSSQSFSWTPTYDQAGSYDVTFISSDGTDQDSETITVTVGNVNRSPVLAVVGDKSVDENSLLSFTISATDPDGDAITYSAQNLPTGSTLSSQSFSWTPTYDQAGGYDVTFVVSDGNDQDSETITITVGNVNRSPVLAVVGDKSVDENSLLSFTISGTDPDGDSITYSAQNLPTGATLSSQSFSWTPTADQAGSYEITFIASDGADQDLETITVTVGNVNRAPVLAVIGDKGVGENSLLSFTISATDPDGDSVTYSIQGLPSGAVFTSQSFTWTPSFDQAGSYNVTFTASDLQYDDSETVAITVDNTNRAPVLSVIGDKSVNADDTLTFTVDSTDPDGDVVTYTASGLPSGATFASQAFSWTPIQNQAGSHNVTFVASDGDLEDSETIVIVVAIVDTTPPNVAGLSPAADAVQVSTNNLITLHVVDSGDGVDANSVVVAVNNDIVYEGDSNDYDSAYGHCRRAGTEADYAFTYQSDAMFDFDQTVLVTVNAADIAGNPMDEYSYSFKTEMRSFGENKPVSNYSVNDSEDSVATAADNNGDVWAVWHTGGVGSRNIYVGRLRAGAAYFDASVALTGRAADQCNPGITVGADNTLYVVWQDNRRGNWDIYMSSSLDGVSWSGERLIADSNDNQVRPAIAVDSRLAARVYVAWQDDRAGNQDIYLAVSSDAFYTKTVTQITSDGSDQAEPALAITADNTAYLAWTDNRNGSGDIYATATNVAGYQNLAVAVGVGDQTSPAMGAEAGGSILHFVWVDDALGDRDIHYAASENLPGSPFVGDNLVDDNSGADQLDPTITVVGSTGSNLYVFVCWQDGRNLAAGGEDTDLYFVEVTSDNRTNVFVGDDSTNTDQSKPIVTADGYGNPYLFWTDNRSGKNAVYFAGATSIDSTPLASELIIADQGGTVGPALQDITTEDDISVTVPPDALSSDVTISVLCIENPPPDLDEQLAAGYELGPSGLEFSTPATVVIPYNSTGPDGTKSVAYWYNPQTGVLSQDGITNIEKLKITPSLRAAQFDTTHFTQFFVGDGESIDDPTNNSDPTDGDPTDGDPTDGDPTDGDPTTNDTTNGDTTSDDTTSGTVSFAVGGSSGGGGGGCSMSATGQGGIVEFVVPYIVLGVVMAVIRTRDSRNRKLRNPS